MTAITLANTFAAPSITVEAANALIAQARRAAAEIGMKATIAITDIAGHLKAFERADGAALLTVDLAIDKAWTASAYGVATHTWNAILRDATLSQIEHRPRMVSVGGGCPIFYEGELVGGIGISGGTALEDQQAAEKALEALGFKLAA